MKQAKRFDELLSEYVVRDGRTPGQLSRKSVELWGKLNQIPKATIVRWLNGEVKKPREWQDLIKLALVLRLTRPETEELLNVGGQPSVAQLEGKASEEEKALFAHLDKSVTTAPVSTTPFLVPVEIPDFVGRTIEVHDIRVALQSKQANRRYCFIGMAGVGKTSLAIHLANLLRPQFPDGVLWAQLDQSDPMTILYAFAEAYGYDVSAYTDLSSRSGRIRDLLSNKRALVILDNAERDEDIRPLLPTKGPCTVIITTRHHDLSVADKAQRFYLQPFSQEKNEALILFKQILGDIRVFQEQAVFAEIAELLGHLPLALAVAAYRLKHEVGWSADDFLARLQQEERRLNEIRRGDQNLLLSFELSYGALPPPLQQFFTTLSVFSGHDFSLDAIARISKIARDDVEDNLRHLCNLSLVQHVRAERFQLHPLLNTFAQSHISNEIVFAHLVNYFIDYMGTHAVDFSALDSEIGNLLLALQIARQRDFDTPLVNGIIALYPYLKARGLYDTARTYLDKALGVVSSTNQLHDRVTILSHLGHLAGKQGQNQQEASYYLEALTLIRQTVSTDIPVTDQEKMKETLITLLNRLGGLAHQQSQFEQAHHYYEEALTLTHQIGDNNKAIALQNNLGLLAFAQGNYQEAKTHYQSALQQAHQFNLPQRVLYVLQNLGVLAEHQGDYATAKTYFTEGLRVAQQIKDPELMSRMLGNLGLVAYALGNLNEAIAQFREGLRLAEPISHLQLICQHRTNMGLIAAARGVYRDANAHYRRALELLDGQELPENRCDVLNAWGECYLGQEKWSEATKLFIEARDMAHKAKLPQQKARSLYGLARLAEKRGNLQEAQRLGRESEQLYAGMGHKRASELFWWLKQLPEPTLDEGRP